MSGVFIFFLGFLGIFWGFIQWKGVNFTAINAREMMRLLIPSVTFLAVGFQLAITAFFNSILNLK